MNKIGIVCDNYKLEKFRAALDGYSFTEKPFTKETTAIFIMVTPDEFDEKLKDLGKICKTLEINFKRSN